MYVFLEGIVELEIQLLFEMFIEKMKYCLFFYFNIVIKIFNYIEEELIDKLQEIEMKFLRRLNIFFMIVIEIKMFMEFLLFMIGEKIQLDDEYWKNFIRLLKIRFVYFVLLMN